MASDLDRADSNLPLGAYFFRLGYCGFGGPIALIGTMHRDLVEDKKWITEDEYQNGLALAQLAPGPLAAQLAIYIGWLKGRALGAALIGLAFVLPSFVIVLVLSALYLRFDGLPWMQEAFYGVGAVVIAIIARSAFRLASRTLKQDLLLWGLAVANAVVTAITGRELAVTVIASGLAYLVVRLVQTRAATGKALSIIPPWLLWGLHGEASKETLAKVAIFFTQAGAFVFGSGLAIVPFLHGGVVPDNRWLTEQQFLDAVAVAMLTPGPVVITVAFIGYLVAGPVGACVAALGTFVPCYLFTVVPAPHFSKWVSNVNFAAFVKGVTAAATGALGGAVIVLARKAVFDVPTVALVCLAALALWKVPKLPEPVLILFAALAGVLAKEITHT